MATVVLPDVLAYCINLALGSGLQLSWKVHDSSFGTSVQLLWKRIDSEELLSQWISWQPLAARLPCLHLERKERRHLRLGEAERDWRISCSVRHEVAVVNLCIVPKSPQSLIKMATLMTTVMSQRHHWTLMATVMSQWHHWMLILLSVTQLLMRKENVFQEFSILLTIMRKDGHQYVNFAGLETGMTQYLEMGLTRTQRILSFQ